MLRSIRNVKLLKCVSLICLSPLFVFYSSLSLLSLLTEGVLIDESTKKLFIPENKMYSLDFN